MVENNCLLKAISFSELTKWNVNLYVNKINIQSKYETLKLSKIIVPRKSRLKNKDYKGQFPIVEKIRFSDGKVFFRTEKNPKTDLNVSCLNDLLVSNINFEKGAFAINKFDTIVTSTDYQSYEILIPINYDYFNQVLRTDAFLRQVKALKSGGMKTRARYDFIKQFSIPIPSLKEQDTIFKCYKKTLDQAEKLEKQAEELEKNIDCYIFQTLGIQEISLERKNDSILSITFFNNLYNWDAKHAILNINPQTLLKSSIFKNIPIQTAFSINPTTTIPKDLDEISFLPMECISDIYGSVIEKRTIDSKTQGYTKFKDNDVIFAKITPCMQNGKCAVVKDLKQGYGMGSTEFHVFRAISDDVIPEYLHSLLRTKMLRKAAMNYFTGSSGQQRVSSEFIENLYIPLPPLPMQEEIVNHINQIKTQIKELRKQAQELREKAKKDFEGSVFE